MTPQSSSALVPESEREMVLERIFDAPRERVFKAWTTAEHLGSWFGPNGFTCDTHSFDFREGGSWGFVMHGPDGTDWDNWMFFTKIDEPSRLEFFHGDKPDIDDPANMVVTVTFEDLGGRTRLTHRVLMPTRERWEEAKGFGAVELGYQTLGKLAAYLERLS